MRISANLCSYYILLRSEVHVTEQNRIFKALFPHPLSVNVLAGNLKGNAIYLAENEATEIATYTHPLYLYHLSLTCIFIKELQLFILISPYTGDPSKR